LRPRDVGRRDAGRRRRALWRLCVAPAGGARRGAQRRARARRLMLDVLVATGLLRAFNEAGVLAPADVHVAQRLAALGREDDERVLLAAALAVRGPRLGHVCVDLATISRTATVEADEELDLGALPWPDGADWIAAVSGSRLVAVGEDDEAR